MRPHIRGPVLHVDWPWLALFGLLELAGWLLLHLALAVKRHPGTATAAAATCAAYRLWTTHPATAPATGAALAAATIWSTTHPETFDAYVGNHLRTHWRRNGYRRRWNRACTQAGFQQSTPQGPIPPQLVHVKSHGPHKDTIRARLDGRETIEDWQRQAHLIARALKVHTVRVKPYKHDQVELTAYRTDPLAEPVDPLPTSENVDLEAIPVGIREDGELLTLPVLYTHVLIAGETGSGKGSILWSLICGIAPAIRAGHARLWVIDPKMVEMAAGEPLFDEFVYGRPLGDTPWQTEMAETLEDAVHSMRERAEQLRGRTRKHTPNTDQPLIVIIIDEIASLTAYTTDPALRHRITDALSLLLSQGRALGITVIAATQDPRKETLTIRDLVPVRVALRAAESTQADMVLGRGARDRGALTDRISPATPGVGYVSADGEPDPVRVRFSYWDDQAIADVVNRHAPPTQVPEAAA